MSVSEIFYQSRENETLCLVIHNFMLNLEATMGVMGVTRVLLWQRCWSQKGLLEDDWDEDGDEDHGHREASTLLQE
jgi:hypothetical protein